MGHCAPLSVDTNRQLLAALGCALNSKAARIAPVFSMPQVLKNVPMAFGCFRLRWNKNESKNDNDNNNNSKQTSNRHITSNKQTTNNKSSSGNHLSMYSICETSCSWFGKSP
eukprot:3193168-Amphidinium_carterae.3